MDNAVAVMRISSDRQDIQGDSIDHQKDQIDRYTQAHNIKIKKYFIFIESASKEQQPVQEAIDYCKNPKNRINLFIIKSIDRFTRGGSSLYDHMKTQLNKHDVRLIDIYGVINNQTVNTLEHLGVQYSWSVYSPSKKSELLEAERGKDELRDIMTRMIGAEVRYTRLGYRVRKAPFGYQNERIETAAHGRRYILAPHPVESLWVRRIFELKVQAQLNDQEIIDHINLMGFKSRKYYIRDSKRNNRAIGFKGENKLEIKTFDRLLRDPIYAGVTIERWTWDKPVKLQCPGLVSIETFNKANTGRVMIIEGDNLEFIKGKQLRKRLVSTARSLKYPYKRLIYCSKCKRPYYGSASRGRLGKYYPAYHCNKRGHYHRVSLKVFHEAVVNFLNQVRIKDEYIAEVQYIFSDNLKNINQTKLEESISIERRLEEISSNMALVIEKIKAVSSQIAIQSLEADLIKLDKEKKELLKKQNQKSKLDKTKKQLSIAKNNQLPVSLIQDHNPTKKTQLFSLLFTQVPTFDDILNKTVCLSHQFEIISNE